MSKRWTRRPEPSTWGDWGDDDQLGRLNLITQDKVKEGLLEAREGLSFCLSLPLDYPGGSDLNPRRKPPVLRPTLRGDGPNFNAVTRVDETGPTDVFCDDLAILHLQYSTQWDALSHVGSHFDADGDGVAEKLYYNGFRAGVDITGPDGVDGAGVGEGSTSHAGKLGIENMAATSVQGRAVMIDLHAHFGDAHTLVDYAMLADVMAKDGVVVEAGDMVCFHTGFAQKVLDAGKQPSKELLHGTGASLDGRDPALLDWITRSGVAILAADNYAVEAFPGRDGEDTCCAMLPLHEHCLFKMGIHLGELWHLTPLANWLRDHGRNRFLLTAPPLRLPGAVGSPVTPIATV